MEYYIWLQVSNSRESSMCFILKILSTIPGKPLSICELDGTRFCHVHLGFGSPMKYELTYLSDLLFEARQLLREQGIALSHVVAKIFYAVGLR
jgi:hypothetical protein